ncbi:MAG: hypothetical protein PHQ32_05605 [Firmicutes bacterium]|nr:hypothetical protein [Bacillota bacterium]
MLIQIPNKPKLIIDILLDQGYQAGLVGGCLRNILLGIEVKDYDIATSATTLQMKKILNQFTIIDLGEKFGTLVIVVEGENIEVTTFRKESNYTDNRHPDKVEFINNLEEDLKRRDFTINALYYNDKVGLIDLFNSINDLNMKIIKAVGDPLERFKEDSLRILRGIRFSAKLKFQLEINTKLAMEKSYPLLSNITKERTAIELIEILNCSNIESTINEFLPIFQYLIPDLGIVNSKKLDSMPSLKLKLAVFFSALSNPEIAYDKMMEQKLTVSSRIRKSDLRDIAIIIKYANIDALDIINTYKEIRWNKELLEDIYKFNNQFDLLTPIFSITYKEMKIKGNDILSLGYKDEIIQQILDECFTNLLLRKVSNIKSAYCDLITEIFPK